MTADIDKLRAAIHTAHDHIHHGRIADAHTALHCGADGEPAEPDNITLDEAARMTMFSERFNHLCSETGIEAAHIILVKSKSVAGAVSIQAGGHVPTIKFMGLLVDKTALAARYRAEREERKALEFAKRNPAAPIV